MSDTRSLDYGWFFLRIGTGLMFIETGARQFSGRNLQLFPIAAIVCGAALLLGLLVRPAVALMLALLISVFITGSRLEFRLVRESVVELLALIGFMVGGGGTFLSLGAAIGGLNGKWYQ